MTKIGDLKGFAYPSPQGIATVVGDLPWHFGTEHLGILYKTDPDVVASYLPEPLEPGENPDVVFIEFGKWFSLWDSQLDMQFVNPERTWYQETVIWVSSSFKGEQGKTCIQTWVDNDFSLARGMFMGFNKKFGQTYKTDPRPVNPKMEPLGIGSKMKGWTCAHGERLMEGTLEITKKIPYAELPNPILLPLFNIRYFPSIVRNAPPSVCELVKIHAEDFRHGEDVWAGNGTIKLFPSELEEFTRLVPKEVIGAFYYTNGCTITGGEVLHNWLSDKP
ncbi:MAG: acetoacetate decarboxylase family protein [Desulfitobacteriia bacterium]|jgi:acetoacetate decarboxylase